MNRWKKLLSLMMALSLIVTSVGGVGFAEEEPVVIVEEMLFDEPAVEPTAEPTTEPTAEPTAEPAVEPTAEPTVEPTAEPVVEEQPPEAADAQMEEPVVIALSETGISLNVGDEYTLTAAVTGASAEEIIWNSSNEQSFTVKNGVVTAVSSGDGTVSATIGDVTAECSVTVKVRLEGFGLSAELSRMMPGGSQTVNAYPRPTGAQFTAIEWSSDDERIATVEPEAGSATGAIIKAVSPGTTMIRLTCGDVSSAYELVVEHMPLTDLAVAPKEVTLAPGEQVTLSITPNEHAQLGDVVWSSDADAIASVENGVVTAKNKGIANITATCGDISVTCQVTVQIPLTHIDINLKAATLINGATLQLNVTPNAGADLGEVTWSSTNEAVATVENGRVTALGAGDTLITAQCGEISATCELTVYEPLTMILLSHTDVVLQPGEALALTALPNEGASLEGLTITSDNEAVATVENGVITAVASGRAVITAACGGIYSNCTVTVKHAVVIGDNGFFVYAGETLAMEYAYQFEDVTELRSAVWSVNDESIATIDAQTGILTGVSKGYVDVTVTCTGGNGETYSATVKVKVAIRATGIAMGQPTLLLDVNGSHTLTATLLPEGAEGVIEWSSSQPEIAAVDQNGVVSGAALGQTVITAKYGDFTATCDVRVEILPQKIDQYSDAMVLYPKQNGKIRYEIRPLNATLKGMTWTTSNASIATVSADGVVKGVKTGKCEITGVSENGIEIKIPVTIVKKGKAVTSMKINASSKTVQRSLTYQLKVTVSPKNASDKSIVWASEHPEIATVNQKGLVTAIAPGTTRILAASSSGVIKTCTITVIPLQVSKVALSKTKATIDSGNTLALTYTLSPADADDLSVTWSTSKASVATVDENGIVTAHKAGTATITCRAASGKTGTCKVTVKAVAPVMDVTKKTIGVGDGFSIGVSYKVATETEMVLTWYSDKPSVADVDQSGNVTTFKAGKANIYCKTQYGVKDSVAVTVKTIAPAMNMTKYTVATDDTFAIGVSYSPDTQQDMELKWYSAKPEIADVDEFGNVTAFKVGKVNIYCEAKNGLKDFVAVTVTNPVPAMNISKYTMAEGETYQITYTCKPETDADVGMQWLSSNEAVVTVADGVITAVGAGTAKVYCTTKYGTSDSATITVKKAVPVMDIAKKTIAVTMTCPVNVTYSPATDQDMGLVWSSSNTAVATVDENGVVTGVGVGSAKIICTTRDGLTDSCTITVVNPAPVMDISKKSVAINMTCQIAVTYSPVTDEEMVLTWRSGNGAIATVEDGIVTAHAVGSAKIYCETQYGTVDSCTINVVSPKPSVVPGKPTVVKGDSLPLSVQYSPMTDKEIGMEWRSANTKIATVDENGVVTGVKPGKVKVYCRTEYGDVGECTITVKAAVPVMDRSKLTLYTDDTFVIPVTFSPATQQQITLKWSTSKPSVATVNAEGVITAMSAGTATITCYTEDGTKDSCKVTVKATPVKEIVLTNPYGDLGVGGKYALEAVCYPDNAANQSLTWKSSNTKIAKVSSSGVVTCLKAGTVKITATAKDGSKVSVGMEITIKQPQISEFALDIAELVLPAGETRQIVLTLNGELYGVAPVWSSSNAKIASVDQNGLITAVGNGVAAITCAVGGESRTVVVVVPRSGDGKYRFLIAGEYTSSKNSGYLNFAVNGLVNVDAAFDDANINGDRYEITRLNNPKEGTLMDTINDTFAGTTNDDVSVLYLMSHGLNVNGEYRWTIAGSKAYITEKELTASLERIKGEVVLVMVSCYSGQYIENYTTSGAEASLKNVMTTVNGSRPGNKKISIIASQSGDMTGSFTDFASNKSYDFFSILFNKALGRDQQNDAAYDEMYADLNDDGVITLMELATYLSDNIQKEIDDHIDKYGEQSVKNTAKNKGKQKVEYYLTSPNLVIYSRVKDRIGKN